MALRRDHEDALLREATAGETQQTRPHLLRQRGRARGVEAELHRGLDLVDVLSAGAGGAQEALLYFPLVEGNHVRDADHARDYTTA